MVVVEGGKGKARLGVEREGQTRPLSFSCLEL